jgi:hypothetical protein
MSKSCSCDSQCPLATDCTCIEIVLSGGFGHCFCECQSVVVMLPHLEEEARLNIEVRKAPLAKVAGFVDRFSTRQLLVPADRLRERVSLDLEYVTFAEAKAALGLVTGPERERPAAE